MRLRAISATGSASSRGNHNAAAGLIDNPRATLPFPLLFDAHVASAGHDTDKLFQIKLDVLLYPIVGVGAEGPRLWVIAVSRDKQSEVSEGRQLVNKADVTKAW